jgi:long-subunit acyl-CoA synthetase (AMP-forming)
MSNPNLASALEAGTLGEAVRRLAARHPERVAVRTVDDAVSFTFAELQRRIDALVRALAGLGVRRGESVALMLSNRPEFFVADLAAANLGAVPFSIYQTLAPDQIAYVVSDAGARVALIEKAYAKPFLEARAKVGGLEHVFMIDADDVPGTKPIATIDGSNPGFDVQAASKAVQPDDLMTLIYTSGTTGPPKGVQLTYRNLFGIIDPMSTLIDLPDGGSVISWLPTAHIAERLLNYYVPMLNGSTITTCPNPREILTYLQSVHPTFFFAVPRIWEKMKAGLEAQLGSLPEDSRAKVQGAVAAAIDKVQKEQAGDPVPPELAAQVAKADAEIFSGIRGLIGLDKALFLGTGAAPTPRDVLEFFHAIGLGIAEGWGMSETCGIGTINPPEKVKLGTVGRAIPSIELKLAPDGELLIRGCNVMQGYRNLPDKTAEAILDAGWLATGDVAQIDDEGYVRIVDRKKEIIINAAGKNMSPSNIESTLKGGTPLIGQVCVIGDARPYNTALVVLDADFAAAWAKQHGLEGKSYAELVREPKVREAVQAGVDAANERLARVEQVKKFTIVPADWLPGGDELTPTMKLKRRPIAQKYAAAIDAMY